ncbi:MAG: M23 family metallopeptidase [Minisyncoccia bacterium]
MSVPTAALLLVTLVMLMPLSAAASHRTNDSYGERYSSSLRKKIQKLDNDTVDSIPVPVLFAPYTRIYPDFGDPRGGGTRVHEGQDILAREGTPILSPTDAVVTRMGKGGSAGVYVYTAAPGGETFRYMHLSEIASGVKVGVELQPGDLIGYVGDTGNAKGGPAHLHFEIRNGRKALDPYPRMDGSFDPKDLLRALPMVLEGMRKDRT